MNQQEDAAAAAAAAAAADAARATPGVARLQPRFWGLVQQIGREMLDRAGRNPPAAAPDVSGVTATAGPDGASIAVTVSLVLRAGHNATTVSAAVQAAVRVAVVAATGLPVDTVTTHIVDVDLAPRAG